MQKDQETPQIPAETAAKQDTRTDKKGGLKNDKGPHQKSQKGDRADTTGFKKHPHGINRKNSDSTNIKQELEGDLNNSDEVNNNKQKNPNKVKYEKVSIYNWDKSKITLETPIPEKPKEKEMIKEPKREELNKKVDDVEKLMENLKNKKNQKIMDISNKDKSMKEDLNSQQTPLQQLFKESLDEIKVKKEEFLKCKAEYEEKDLQVQALFKRQQELRNKMKKCSNEKDIISDLQACQKRFDNEQLTNQEEKKLVAQIEDLKLSLPFAKPLQALEEEKQEIEKQSKALKGKMGAAYKAMKQIQEKIDEYRQNIDSIKKNKQEGDDKSFPEITQIKEEYQKNIEELKKKKHALYQDFDTQQKGYRDQQELIRYHDYVRKQHDYLKRQEKNKKFAEEKLKREQEELIQQEQQKKNKYLVFVEISENLIKYLERLQGKATEEKTNQDEQQQQQKQLNNEDIAKMIKAEKMTVLVSKKDKSDKSKEIFGGGNFKGKAQKKKEQLEQQQQQPKAQEKVNDSLPLAFPYEILQDFEKLSVQAPTFKQDIEKILAQLVEKKKYFEELPNTEGGIENQEQVEKNQANKKQKESTKQINFDDQQFPTIN